MKLTSDDAFELSDRFRDLVHEVREWRKKHKNELDECKLQDLDKLETRLLTQAAEFTTAAVGLVLDESEASAATLKEVTGQARDAIKTLQTIRKVIAVMTAAVGLAGAIASKDVGAVGRNAKLLYDVATTATA